MESIGATLFQMFSPSKSPFYATALGAALCLWFITGNTLAGYGVGAAITVLAVSVLAAPFMRVKLSAPDYNYSLVYGRSIGTVGSLGAIVVLVDSAVSDRSNLFYLMWVACIACMISMYFLFVLKAKVGRSGESGSAAPSLRFNVVQFCLIQSTLLVVTVKLALGEREAAGALEKSDALATYVSALALGFRTVLEAVPSVFTGELDGREQVVAALIFLTTLNFLLGLACIIPSVAPGVRKDYKEFAPF